MRLLVILLMCCLAGCATDSRVAREAPPAEVVTQADPLDMLDWMTGSWAFEQDGRRSEEYWTPPAGGSMMGVGRMIAGGRTVFFEYLQLRADSEGRIVYLASPLGRHPPTPFTLIEHDDESAVFENPEHDFPQRITYRFESPDTLHAVIEGEQNGQPRREAWTWQRMR